MLRSADLLVTRHTRTLERVAMAMRYALMSHGEVLGYTGAAFPSAEVPAGASVWHFVPTAGFDVVEPIVAELTAPPALALVDEVIPTQDAYLHPARNEQAAQMERLMNEAASIHHFRLVLERYERLELELHDAAGRVATSTLLVTKQLVSSDALHAYMEVVEPAEAHRVDTSEPCYLLMARLANASVEAIASAA